MAAVIVKPPVATTEDVVVRGSDKASPTSTTLRISIDLSGRILVKLKEFLVEKNLKSLLEELDGRGTGTILEAIKNGTLEELKNAFERSLIENGSGMESSMQSVATAPAAPPSASPRSEIELKISEKLECLLLRVSWIVKKSIREGIKEVIKETGKLESDVSDSCNRLLKEIDELGTVLILKEEEAIRRDLDADEESIRRAFDAEEEAMQREHEAIKIGFKSMFEKAYANYKAGSKSGENQADVTPTVSQDELMHKVFQMFTDKCAEQRQHLKDQRSKYAAALAIRRDECAAVLAIRRDELQTRAKLEAINSSLLAKRGALIAQAQSESDRLAAEIAKKKALLATTDELVNELEIENTKLETVVAKFRNH